MRRPTRKVMARIGWLSLALTFLMTGVILVAVVGWQATRPAKTEETLACRRDSAIKINEPAADGSFSDTKLAGFEPLARVDKLECIDIKEGSSAAATAASVITVHYVGALAKDGTIFDNSYRGGEPLSIGLNQVIPGWTEGVPGMKVGGLRRLLIPAALGYGAASPSETIPANADLVFDIKLVNVQ